MSMNVLKEFLIHFHTFRNIDLVNQGLYQIRSRIYYHEKTTKLCATPYHYSDSKENESTLLSDENTKYNIISNHIGDNNIDYVTKTFAIRYSDEEVDIDEFCYYRIEIPFEKNRIDLNFTIEISLYFSDSYMNLIRDKKEGQSTLEFKCTGIQTITVKSNSSGYNETYAPIIYKDSFSSILNCSVHAINIDYKLRIDNINLFAVEEVDSKQIATAQALAKKYLSEKGNSMHDINSNKNITTNCESIGQFLLDSEGKPLPLDLNERIIDEVYFKYVVSLVDIYLKLKNNYLKIQDRLLDDKMKSEFPFFTIIQPLFIYFEEKDKQVVDSLDEVDLMNNRIEFPAVFLNFSKRINDWSIEYVSCRILLEINFISAQLFQIWHKYIELIRYFPMETNYILSNEFYSKYKENLSLYLKKSIITVTETKNLLIPIENNIGDINKANAEDLRKLNIEKLKPPALEISSGNIKTATFPILFEENYIKQTANLEYPKNSIYELINIEMNGIQSDENINMMNDSFENDNNNRISLHLIILVHGFQGNSHDMRLIKNTISLISPGCILLPSSSNQDDTECDFIEMGKKLANEVKNFLKDWNEGSVFNRISFIGHSIGGLIIRAALPFLTEYSTKMWLYMSLSTPHLGYIYSTSKLIEAGIWLLKTWKKSKSLEQLSLSDEKELKESCIYKLSAMDGLNWFNHIYLISSHQDMYAPYESTRIQLCDQSFTDNYRADVYRSMAYNILSKITISSLRRVDVNFFIPEKSLDSFIGRTAHIQFLENISFMKILLYSIENLLK